MLAQGSKHATPPDRGKVAVTGCHRSQLFASACEGARRYIRADSSLTGANTLDGSALPSAET